MTLVVSSHFFPEASRIPRTFSISWCKIHGSKELTQLKIHWNPAISSTSCGKFRTTLSGASWWRWTGTHAPTSSRAVASRSVSSSWNVARSGEGLQTTSKIQQNPGKMGFGLLWLLWFLACIPDDWARPSLKRDFIQLGRCWVKSLEFEHQTQQFLGMLLLIENI